jgi:Tol biopolymer transport system component
MDRGQFTIELQHVATASRTVIVGPTEKEVGRPKFSPDGNYLFYRSAEERGAPGVIYRVPIFGGAPRMIANQIQSDVSVSPDGEWLAFVRFHPDVYGQQLMICRSSDGSELRVVTSRTGNESFAAWGYSPAWSPDGKSLFVGPMAPLLPEHSDTVSRRFGLVNVADGTFEAVKTPNWNALIQAEWMPDRKTFLILAKEAATDPFQIWKMEHPSGTVTRITNDPHDYRYFSISVEGRSILATQEKTYFNLWSIPIEDPQRPNQLTFSSELRHGQHGMAWTPNDKSLVYILNDNHTNSNLWKLDTETLETQQLTFDSNTINRYPNVTPDGKVIFTSSRENGTHIWSIDLDGGHLRRVTNGDSEGFSSVTSDGRWLIFASPAWDPEALWKQSLVTGDPAEMLLTAVGGSNAPSRDGKQIIVSYKTKAGNGALLYRYGLMPLESTGDPENIGFNPYYGAIAWRPDESGFYYIKDQGVNLGNIWSYDVLTKAHKQITDYHDRMFSLSLSSDGKTLATARGQTISNVFRISGF